MNTPTPAEQRPAMSGAARHRARALFALVVCAALVSPACRLSLRGSLPASLSDEEFWRLTTSLSESGGTFEHSENLVSNERQYVHLMRSLDRRGGVYIGVGPEQNFSYIVSVRPDMAFIIDIRPENRSLHLLYKALFELSRDRADFLSRLFSRERPAGVGPDTSVADLFAAYDSVRPAAALLETNARLVRERLVGGHRFPLSPSDLAWVDHAMRAFFTDGPEIQYGRARPLDSPGPSYRVLMTAADWMGESRSYLASEATFTLVKDLHTRNLIVPLVGDFAGPKTLREAGNYIRQHRSMVNTFYGSNVEVYLTREKRRAYCATLATLPYDGRSWFVSSKATQRFAAKLQSCAPEAR